MSATNAFETSVLALFFNATTIANLAINATSSPATVLYISLHTADPGETGTQTTSETTYGSYARVSVARTSGGFTISGNTVSNTADTIFPMCTSGSGTLTHFGIGLASTGTGTLLFSGALNSTLAVSANVTPEFLAGQLTTTCD